MQRAGEGRDPAAAVAMEHDIVSEQLLQPVEITVERRREEALRELRPPLAGRLEVACAPASPCPWGFITVPRMAFAGANNDITYGPKWDNAYVATADALSRNVTSSPSGAGSSNSSQTLTT